ncbi:hypothetical protein, partial [Salmonella enterica]|uniref:hypothetical protein n=1 Tax=Salmonella enterica TaxID=28901 RepID=UPI001C60C5AD
TYTTVREPECSRMSFSRTLIIKEVGTLNFEMDMLLIPQDSNMQPLLVMFKVTVQVQLLHIAMA